MIYAAVRLVEPSELRRLARFRQTEAALAVLTAIAVIAFGVLWGVLAAIALSLADLLRRIVRPHDAVLGLVPGLAGMHDVLDHDHADQVPGLLVYRYDSPLFSNAADFVERALPAVDAAHPPVRRFVLDAEADVDVDLTAADALAELRRCLERRDVALAVAHLRTEMRQTLAPTGWLGRIGEDLLFETLPTAVDAYRRWLARRPGRD